MKYILLSFCIVSISFLLSNVKTQEYNDQLLLEHIVKDTKLRKCNCKAREIYVNGTCVEGNTTVPIILFRDILEPFSVPTENLRVLENSGMRCGSTKSRAVLDPRDFFILPAGEIINVAANVTFTPIEYCINHVLDDNNNITWEVEMCLKTPEIPVCCQSKAQCHDLSLPIWFLYSQIKEIFTVTKNTEIGKCPKGQIVSTAKFETGQQTEALLAYDEGSLQLVVTSRFPDLSLPKYFSSNEYCISQRITKKGTKIQTAHFCIQDPLIDFQHTCKGFTCVRKCCPDGYVYSYEHIECITYDEASIWSPTFRDTNLQEVAAPENLRVVYGFPICKTFYILEPSDQATLLSNGSIMIKPQNTSAVSQFVKPPYYCIDNFLSKNNFKISRTVLNCFPEEKKDNCKEAKFIIVPILLMCSCVFLLITLVVYITIPELHAKLHGKSLLSHVTALFVSYLSLAVIQWYSITTLSIGLRRGFGSVIQISFLSAFFWLNVMCFDIWWTLRSMRPVAESSESSRRRFVYYSIYAWGSSFLIGMVTVAMDQIPDVPEYSYLMLPGLGVGHRDFLFKDRQAMWVYFYGFVLILNLVNTFFFICVAIILIQAQRANNSILRTTNKQHKERVWIYLKLFVVMGITWICEVVSWEEGTCEYWFVTDLINSLQGFFIFLIFICKKNIFIKLRARGTASTRNIRRMVQGTSSYGSSTQVTQQTSLDSTRKLSTSLYYHLSKLSRDNVVEEPIRKY